jgi:hypothetical protein
MSGRIGTVIAACALFGAACGNVEQVEESSSALESVDGQGKPEPPMLGVHHARGVGGGGSNALMTWHNGAILQSATVTAIFWGTSWSNSSFVADKITGLASFYQGYGGSNYANASTEYSGSNGQVGSAVSYGGNVVDASPGPARAPRVSTIQTEVCRTIANPTPNGYYPVYVDAHRGSAQYCAWHSYGSCNGVPVQFGFFFNLDGDAGCDPQDTRTVSSQGLQALANVSAHELSETMTDPRNGGWYDSGGNENGDKCAWTFNVPYVTFANDSPTNHSTWKLQGEWSNAAFSASTGYPNRSGQLGCLDGH